MPANNQSDSAALPLYWHPAIALHDPAAEHGAMDKQRLAVIAEHLLRQPWAREIRPTEVEVPALALVHDADYLGVLHRTQYLAEGEHYAFNSETRANQHTWRTLALSAGAWLQATQRAVLEQVPAAFCIGYAGHHARWAQANGFCFVNGAAAAARHALTLGAERVAVIDFDTHAGDGTVLSVLEEPRVFFGETYQPGFPGGFLTKPTRDGILRMRVDSPEKFQPYWTRIFEELRAFNPEVVLVSAGFDAHADDPLTYIGVLDGAYAWLGQQLAGLPCPVVCGLEGGYNLDSTRRCAALFCSELARKPA